MGQEVSVLSVKEFCAAEAMASNNCLELMSYDREKCGQQFQDYRDCKKRWREYRNTVAMCMKRGETPPDLPEHVVEHLVNNPSRDERAYSATRQKLHSQTKS